MLTAFSVDTQGDYKGFACPIDRVHEDGKGSYGREVSLLKLCELLSGYLDDVSGEGCGGDAEGVS